MLLHVFQFGPGVSSDSPITQDRRTVQKPNEGQFGDPEREVGFGSRLRGPCYRPIVCLFLPLRPVRGSQVTSLRRTDERSYPAACLVGITGYSRAFKPPDDNSSSAFHPTAGGAGWLPCGVR